MHCQICDYSQSLDGGVSRVVKYDKKHNQWICNNCIEESRDVDEIKNEKEEDTEIQAALPQL